MGRHQWSRPLRDGCSGFSQVELLCAITVLALAMLGFSVGLISSLRMASAVRERALATEHARRVIEELQDTNFAQVFALYDATAADDPGGAGTAPGASFTVEGLTPVTDDADGKVGEIVFPVSGSQLREDVVSHSLGMPRDLNGNGAIDASDHAADYQLLPVLVRVRWRSQGAPMTVELRTILCQR